MSGYVMICVGLAGRALTREGRPPPIGQYLKSYDPEAHDGQGYAEWTADPAQARVFPDRVAVGRCWATVPKARPRRPDDAPNRPLTAFDVEIAPLGGDDQ